MNPQGDRIVISGGKNDGHGFWLGMDPDGNVLWEYELSFEQPTSVGAVAVHPQGRARFTPGGSVAYVMASGEAGYPGNSYVYALQVGPIAELGHGLAGAAGMPHLQASGSLVAGSPVEVTSTDALPGASLFLVAGTEAVGVPFKGGVLVPSPDVFVGLLVDPSGGAQFSGTRPAGAPSNASLYAQAWVQDASGPAGWAASNALSPSTP